MRSVRPFVAMASPGTDDGGGEATDKQQPAKTSPADADDQDARLSKRQGRRPAPGSWSCPDGGCDALNSARRSECKVCGTPKPGTVLDVGFGGAPKSSRSGAKEQSTASDGRRAGRGNDGVGDGGSGSGIPSADERRKAGKSSASADAHHEQQLKITASPSHPPPPPPPQPASQNPTGTSDVKRSGRKRLAPGSWPCPLCQTLNSARRERCKACNKLKPEDGGGVMLEGFGRASSGKGSMSDSDRDEEGKRKIASARNRSKSRSAERIRHHRSRSRSTEREAFSGSGNADDDRHHPDHHRMSTSSSKRWTCSACTLLNSDKRARCKACRTPREGEGDSTSKRLRRSRSKDSVHSSSDQHPSHRKRPHRSKSADDGDALRRQESRRRSNRRRSHHSRSPSQSRSSSPGNRKKPSRRGSMSRSKSDGRRLRSSHRRSKSGRKSRQRSRSMSLSSGNRSSEEKVVSSQEVSTLSAVEIVNAALKKEAEGKGRKGSLPKSGSKCDLYLLHSKVTESASATIDDKQTFKPPTSVEGGTANHRALFGGSTSFSMADITGLDTDKRRASMELAGTFKSENVVSGQMARRASISIVPSMASMDETEAEGKVPSTGKAKRHASMDFVPSSWTEPSTNSTEPAGKNSSASKVERRPAPGSWKCPKEECGKLNSARRKECKLCAASKPKRDTSTDTCRSDSRRSKSRRRHRSKSKSRSSGKKERRTPTSASKETKSKTRSKKIGDDAKSGGGKSDTDHSDLKQAAAAIATAGAVVATADAATVEGGRASSEEKDVDPKKVAGKDADNSTGTTTTTATSSPQSSSKTNDEEDQKQLIDKADGVQMTSRVDRRRVMSRGGRARRSMTVFFNGQEEILVLTPATLESNFVSTIRRKTRGPAKYLAFASAFFVVVFVILLVAFFEFAPVFGVPIWQPVLAIGNQLIESIIETTLYIMAVYLILKKGAVLAMYFVRHCGLYVGMVCLAYAIGDISLLVQYGSGGANDGGERWARVTLSMCLAVSSIATAVLLQGRICTKIELRALNSVTGETDDEIALYLKKDRHLTPDGMRKKREKIKDWYHRTMFIAVLGYQILAVMIPLASSAWYLINDVGSLTDFNLCRYTTSRCVDITIKQQDALVDKDVEIKWDLQNGALILSILESIGAFSHDAFVLAIFSKAALFPHNPGSVGIAAFAAFGKLSLAIGYLINLLLLWTSDNLAEGLVWSMCFAILDIACASLVLVACLRFTPTLRRAWKSTVRDNESDELGDSSHKRLGCKTLRSIAFSAQQLLNPKKKKWAKALFISTLTVFLLDSLQGILVLIETTNQFGNTYIAETFKFSMHICLFYAFVNYFSVSDRGKHFYKSRRAMGAIAISGVLIRSWQMAQMVVESEELAEPTTGTDRFVQSILCFDLLANLGLLISVFAISDLDLSEKSTRQLSSAEYSPVAVESGATEVKEDSRTQLLLAKMVEGDLRGRARNVFCLYLISVWVYSMSLAIFDGLISGTAPYMPATFDHTLDNMLAASVALTDAMNQQEMTTRRSLYAITPRLRPFVFVLALSRPGLEIFFHYGLVFSIFCFDGLRKKPRKRYSLVTAGTFAFHAFALILVFLIAMTYSSVTSSNAMADFINAGDDDDDAVTEDGNISALLGVASSFVREKQDDHSAAEIIPFLCLIIWFIFLLPMAVTIHMLWKGRRRIHNIVSGGENTHGHRSGNGVDVDVEAAIAADIETRALLAQPADADEDKKDKKGGATSHSTSKKNENDARKESSEARSSKKKNEEPSRSRKTKRPSTKRQRRKEGEDAAPSQKKSERANETTRKPSKSSEKGGHRRSSTLEADSGDEDRDKDDDKEFRSRSSKKKDCRDVAGSNKSVGKADGKSEAAAGKGDARRRKSSSEKSRGSSKSKSRGQSSKRKDTSVSKASKDKSKAIDGGAHASNTKEKGIPSDTKLLKSQSLAEKKEQKEPQRVPKKKGDADKNEEVSKEKQATSDVKEKEKKSNKGSLPPTGGPTGRELV